MEYRICWSASSNITFRGSTDWEEVEDPDQSEEEFLDMLDGNGGISDGLEMALNASGFEWWVETR